MEECEAGDHAPKVLILLYWTCGSMAFRSYSYCYVSCLNPSILDLWFYGISKWLTKPLVSLNPSILDLWFYGNSS